MLDLRISQNWLEKSSDSSIEEFKSVLVEMLNNSPEDRFTQKRWAITKSFEGNISQLFYDERVLASLTTEKGELLFKTELAETPREDDILFALRYTAERLSFAVYSNLHNGCRLPQAYSLALDHSYFLRSKPLLELFEKSDFIPRYSWSGVEKMDDERYVSVIYPPYYAENKKDGSLHIINDAMLNFLISKTHQESSDEFSYKVADSLNDFGKKYDLGLVPQSFYQNYKYTTKIINNTYFDVFHINRKVFISPYVWDFDADHDTKFYKNIKNGVIYMDKVRNGEDLNSALTRFVRDELRVSQDYVGAKVWGIEFDRDKEGILTPRLKINVFVHGLLEKHQNQDHDWVSLK
jgi:hypothetical protein